MDTSNPLLNLTADQLRRASTVKEQIDALTAELSAILGGSVPSTAPKPEASTPAPSGKRTMSAAGRANIAAAVKERWAKIRAAKGGAAPAANSTGEASAKKKRTMSPAAKKKIAAAMKARWAKVRAEKSKA